MANYQHVFFVFNRQWWLFRDVATCVPERARRDPLRPVALAVTDMERDTCRVDACAYEAYFKHNVDHNIATWKQVELVEHVLNIPELACPFLTEFLDSEGAVHEVPMILYPETADLAVAVIRKHLTLEDTQGLLPKAERHSKLLGFLCALPRVTIKQLKTEISVMGLNYKIQGVVLERAKGLLKNGCAFIEDTWVDIDHDDVDSKVLDLPVAFAMYAQCMPK